MDESDSTEEIVSEKTEDLYDEEPVKEEKVPEPKKVVVCEEVNPVVLANTAQLMSIVGIDESRKAMVQKWVQAKNDQGQNGINWLLNVFLDEMSGKF